MNDFVDSPREPLRPVVADPGAFDECLAALSDGRGRVAFDAERAHGYRYWPKAYLFQIRREGAGTWLLDPIALEKSHPEGLGELVEACGDVEWIIHAASQDLPCMHEVGIVPEVIFDTELAARLLGEPSVSLAALLESKLGIRLRKAHSAQNWATRPLPEDWLNYAALDVDHLLDLADVIESELVASNRMEWAQQEFRATQEKFSSPAEPRAEPWRRLSGITTLRTPRQLAVARALWNERDRIGQRKDRPPTHLLPNQAIVDLASRVTEDGPLPGDAEFQAVGGFRRRTSQRYRANWRSAVASVAKLSSSQYPRRRPVQTGPPHPRNWWRRHPEAAELWERVRPAVDDLACDLVLQASLLAPSVILQQVVLEQAVLHDFGNSLRRHGAREWQIGFLEPLLNEVAQESSDTVD